MLRKVRNFWIDLNVDGNKSVSVGSKNKNGGIRIELYMRNKKEVEKILSIRGVAFCDGMLRLSVNTVDGKFLEYIKER